tara:strand:+ start:1482 stop:2117 length:636 start_codon:yes stop_codon:yes gene_type:complete
MTIVTVKSTTVFIVVAHLANEETATQVSLPRVTKASVSAARKRRGAHASSKTSPKTKRVETKKTMTAMDLSMMVASAQMGPFENAIQAQRGPLVLGCAKKDHNVARMNNGVHAKASRPPKKQRIATSHKKTTIVMENATKGVAVRMARHKFVAWMSVSAEKARRPVKTKNGAPVKVASKPTRTKHVMAKTTIATAKSTKTSPRKDFPAQKA